MTLPRYGGIGRIIAGAHLRLRSVKLPSARHSGTMVDYCSTHDTTEHLSTGGQLNSRASFEVRAAEAA